MPRRRRRCWSRCWTCATASVDAEPGRWLTWHGRGLYGRHRYACGEHRNELKAVLREHYGTIGWHPWAADPHPWAGRRGTEKARRLARAGARPLPPQAPDAVAASPVRRSGELVAALDVHADLFVSTWALNESTPAARALVAEREWFGASALLLAGSLRARGRPPSRLIPSLPVAPAPTADPIAPGGA